MPAAARRKHCHDTRQFLPVDAPDPPSPRECPLPLLAPPPFPPANSAVEDTVGRQEEPLRSIAAIVIASLTIPACATSKSSACRAVTDVEPGQSPVQPYWRKGTFVPEHLVSDGYADALLAAWLSIELCAMDEPPLPELDADESYRVIWLRSLHSPVTVRVSRTGDRYSLRATRLSAPIGGSVRVLAERKSRSLTEEEWRDIVRLIDRSDFFDMSPLHLPATTDERSTVTMDGAEWALEGVRDGSYHIATRGTPSASEDLVAFRAAFLHLLKLSEIDLAEIY